VFLKHAVAALLFVTMAAAPVTGIVCVVRCFPAEIQTSSACHHASTMLGIAISPFLTGKVMS
jgi:hypothetical protein